LARGTWSKNLRSHRGRKLTGVLLLEEPLRVLNHRVNLGNRSSGQKVPLENLTTNIKGNGGIKVISGGFHIRSVKGSFITRK